MWGQTAAGTYTVTAIFSPDANHTLASGNYTATLTIRKAAQNTPMAALEHSDSNSLTVSAVPGAEYSIDGGMTWQDSNVFPGLQPDRSYTILVRMKEDENHLPSGTRPVAGTTTNIPVDVLKDGMPDYSTIYNGSRQPYPYTYLAANMEGVKTVSVMYAGAMANGKPYESSEAPVNAGDYKVRFYLTAEENYDLSADQLYANMTIATATQTMDTAPTIANRTTTTIALNPVPTQNNAPVPSVDMKTELLTATGTYPEYRTGTEGTAATQNAGQRIVTTAVYTIDFCGRIR